MTCICRDPGSFKHKVSEVFRGGHIVCGNVQGADTQGPSSKLPGPVCMFEFHVCMVVESGTT